jgi:hypothetical protein
MNAEAIEKNTGAAESGPKGYEARDYREEMEGKGSMNQAAQLDLIRAQVARVVGRLNDAGLSRLAAVWPVFFYLVESVASERLSGGRGVTDRFTRRLNEGLFHRLLIGAANLRREIRQGAAPLDVEPELLGVATYLWINEHGIDDVNEAMIGDRSREVADWFARLVLDAPWLN